MFLLPSTFSKTITPCNILFLPSFYLIRFSIPSAVTWRWFPNRNEVSFQKSQSEKTHRSGKQGRGKWCFHRPVKDPKAFYWEKCGWPQIGLVTKHRYLVMYQILNSRYFENVLFTNTKIVYFIWRTQVLFL